MRKHKIEHAAQVLQISMPLGDMPLSIKLIALFTLTGGLSIMGSMFVDLLRPAHMDIRLYFSRLIIGLFAIGVAYGITKQRTWALWLYTLIVIIGYFNSPLFAILPAVALIYLFSQRSYFK